MERFRLIYAVSVPPGQEQIVAQSLAIRSKSKKLPITRIAAPRVVSGYVFIESSGPHFVDSLISGVESAKARTKGVISPEALDAMNTGRCGVGGLKPGDYVEVIAGPLRGKRARIAFFMTISGKDGRKSMLALEGPWGTIRADNVRAIAQENPTPFFNSKQSEVSKGTTGQMQSMKIGRSVQTPGYIGLGISWLGHDAFRIQNEKVVYIDPFQIASGPAADVVLVTHEHLDHCSVDDLKKIVTSETIVVSHDQSKDKLSKIKAKIKIVRPGDRFNIGDMSIEAVPAYNVNKYRAPGILFHPKEDGKLGFIVTLNGVRIYHAGDTDIIPEMRNMHPDIALLPVSGTYVMTPEEAAGAVAILRPEIAIPMHYGSIIGNISDARAFQKLASCKVEILEKGRMQGVPLRLDHIPKSMDGRKPFSKLCSNPDCRNRLPVEAKFCDRCGDPQGQ